MQDPFESGYNLKSWFDPTLNAAGWLDDELADSVASAVTVSPDVGGLQLDGFAPALQLPVTVSPGAGGLDLAGFAPTLQRPVTATPGAGVLDLTGLAPAVQRPVAALPGAGALSLAGFAPTVGRPRTVGPGAGSLALTGAEPNVIISSVVGGRVQDSGRVFTPADGVYCTIRFNKAATVFGALSIGDDATFNAGLFYVVNGVDAPALLYVSGDGTDEWTFFLLGDFGPNDVFETRYETGKTINLQWVDTGEFLFDSFGSWEPGILNSAVTNALGVAPHTGDIVVAGFAPSPSLPVSVRSNVGSLIVAGYAPTIDTPAGAVTVAPGCGDLQLSGFAPAAVTAAPQPRGGFFFTQRGRRRRRAIAPETATPGTGELTVHGYAPTIETGRAIAIEPATGALIVEGFAPSIDVPVVEKPIPANRPKTELPPVGRKAPGRQEPPFISLPVALELGAGELLVAGYAPEIEAPNTFEVTAWSAEQDDEDLEEILLLLASR